ncbi:hypothetical protein OC25_11145 [Pedobacter kyungheensis]|uniref:Uncharacterized protein n=1 Tax=Pedobacter kyungheensis TaxID=1069985 RepID=A0A0C1DIT9_9SPHI|nr:hypothetical protein OC25_11145 [Pedobacter kyungheensis]
MLRYSNPFSLIIQASKSRIYPCSFLIHYVYGVTLLKIKYICDQTFEFFELNPADHCFINKKSHAF